MQSGCGVEVDPGLGNHVQGSDGSIRKINLPQSPVLALGMHDEDEVELMHLCANVWFNAFWEMGSLNMSMWREV